MPQDVDVDQVAGALLVSLGLLQRRLRHTPVQSDLTLPETAALGRLDRGGPTTASAMAKLEQISAQSMGATLSGLEARGLVERRPDESDGRLVVLSATDAGLKLLRDRRDARTQQLAEALSNGFTDPELRQLQEAARLIERLADNV